MASRTPTNEETLAWAAESLKDSVSRLASEPPEQLAYLQHLGTYPLTDELALEFDDAFLLSDQLVSAGRLSDAVRRQLARIDALLDELSDGEEENWLPPALESDRRWQEVRELARSILPCL